ncbi:MAG TPA: hypothetical protein VN903_30170 [Polyangia bacterium]|nr:hypothetical protein [Polyangia bacterium]
MPTLTPRRVTTFRLDEELLEAMQALYERDGILPAEQARRALQSWLESKGIKVKTERKRAVTRKRS